jgi:hypothetical protein
MKISVKRGWSALQGKGLFVGFSRMGRRAMSEEGSDFLLMPSKEGK